MIQAQNKFARIEVQQHFCHGCSIAIKKELSKIKALDNIRLYPKESLITFNFIEVNKLSRALNILSEIGYPEKGDKFIIQQFTKPNCTC